MSRVKCQDTQEWSTSNVAYKAPNGKYYTTSEAYEKIAQNITNRKVCINKIYNVLGYKDFMKLPTLFYKKLKEWEPLGYDVVSLTIDNKQKDIEWAVKNKSFQSETAKVMYVSAIIENNIMDAYKQMERIKKNIGAAEKINTVEVYETDLTNIGTTNHNKSVVSLLGDL